MEVASPPKRMTRARAAAKDKDSKEAAASNTTAAASVTAAATTTKSARAAPSKSATSSTAASKAKVVTTTRATKRKTRSDEDEDDQANADKRAMNKPARTRGRPKKVVEPEPQPEPEAEVDDTSATTVRATRGRAKKTVATTTTATTTVTPATTPKEEPVKTTRTGTRTRKTATTTATEDNNAESSEKPAKKTTRARAASKSKAAPGVITTTVSTEPTPGLKSAISRPASKMGGIIKKTVTFQEREKENLLPTTAPKGKGKAAELATGMRAKPVRKPVAGGRTTRASARSGTTSEKRDKSPLSPKKDAENLSLSRDIDSDDELATLEKTPFKPLMKCPVKPPNSAKKHELQPPTKDKDGDSEETSEPASQTALGSPARRPPSSSPWKETMKSPAKKVEAIPSLIFSSKNDQHAAQSPSKTSTLQSPAKRPQMPIQSLQPPSHESAEGARSPVKMSLLQSPAKRPASPFKLHGPPAQPLGENPGRLFAPKASLMEEKVATTTEEVQEDPSENPEEMEDDIELELEVDEQHEETDVQPESPSQVAFNGRLSAVLPRHADPALRDNPLPVENVDIPQPEPVQVEQDRTEEQPIMEAEGIELPDDPMDIDVPSHVDVPSPAPTTPPQSPRIINPAFGLRAKDLDDDISDSEDELANSGKMLCRYQDDTTLSFNGVPATPTPGTFKTPRSGMPSSAVKAASRAIRSVSKSSRFGFTPLAGQLSEWKASSPQKASAAVETSSPEFKDEGFSMLKEHDTAPAEFTPSKSLFDEEMKIRADMETQAAMEAALEADIAAKFDEPEFDDVSITKEDIDLAAEANEMSLMEQSQLDDVKESRPYDDSISEASQEYGDENAVPIDPALLGPNTGGRRLGPVTPLRPFAPRAFHTVSKVPLKPADDSSPKLEIMKHRSASASKLPANRPTGLFRNATVISYSPTKDSGSMDIDEDDEVQYPPVTPSKTDIWSSMGTPARTPRCDLNTSLLRGAVVFVDVHTSDGADACTLFVELLTQMGARCVKSWPWNPTSPANANGDASTSKVGITHIVFKDGGKRTLEKARETGGVVQCVGVGWVLE